MSGMAHRHRFHRSAVMIALTAPLRWFTSHFGPHPSWGFSLWRRRRPDAAGVREPRRPKPTLPAAAVALAEPRTEIRRRIRLRNLRDN
jgi:hypothetical protein